MTSNSKNNAGRLQKTRMREDMYYLNKARRRIQRSLVLAFVMMWMWPLAVYFVLSQPMFPKPSYFNTLYLLVFMIETAVWMIIFFVASSGKKFSRGLFTLALWCEFGFAAWLVWDMFHHLNYIPFYMAWILLALFRDGVLVWFKNWLYSSWFGQIFFYHYLVLPKEARRQGPPAQLNGMIHNYGSTIIPGDSLQQYGVNSQGYAQAGSQRPSRPVYHQNAGSGQMPQSGMQIPAASAPSYGNRQTGAAPAGTSRPAQSSIQSTSPSPIQNGSLNYGSPDLQGDRIQEEKDRLARQKAARHALSSRYPRAAVRMAIGVYGELILFPIITHVLQNFFVSTDNNSVFAVGLMFTLCIITAMIWTFPIFFFYLKYPGSKKSLWAALIGQLGVIAYTYFTLRSYWSSDTVSYPDSVFILFLSLELVRYGLLIIAISPAFRLPAIKDPLEEKSRSSRFFKIRGDEDEEGTEFELYEDEDDHLSDHADSDSQNQPSDSYSQDEYGDGQDDEYGDEYDDDDDAAGIFERWPFRRK